MNIKTITTLLICLSLISLQGCSTYRSKSGMAFDGTELYGQKPKVHVGEIEESVDQVTFVAKIFAVVKKPIFSLTPATREQVNIVLGEKAAALNADAVIYVKYRENMGNVWAEGQAVKINKLYADSSISTPMQAEPVAQVEDPETTPTQAMNLDAQAIVDIPPTRVPDKKRDLYYPPSVAKQPLTQASSREQALLLGTIEELINYKPFIDTPHRVRVFAAQTSVGKCWRTLESCPNVRLLISVATGDLYDTPKLYELPPEKGWTVVKTMKTVENTIGIILKTELPDGNISRSEKSDWKPKQYTVWLGLSPTYEVLE